MAMKRLADIPRLLDELGIKYRTHGGELWAPCPSPKHKETRASWSIQSDPQAQSHGVFYCLAAETMVMTPDGAKPIASLVGQQTLLTATLAGVPAWVQAPIRSFGNQRLWKVTLSRNGIEKVVRTSKEHRWFVHRQGNAAFERTTDQLRAGHAMRSVSPPRSGSYDVSPWGVAHGFTFGDGTRCANGECSVNLWGEKDAALLPFFPLSPKWDATEVGGAKCTLVRNLPASFKEWPPMTESAQYLYGWLAGYFAADGCVDESGVPSMASAKRENLEFVERVCLRLGIFTHGIRQQERVGLGDEASTLFSITFRRSSLTEAFFIGAEHKRRWKAFPIVRERLRWVVKSVEETADVEEVFCAVVPETHAFALEGNILTGNCFGCHFTGNAPALVMERLGGVSWGHALQWMTDKGLWLKGTLPLECSLEIRAPRARKLKIPAGLRGGPLETWVTPARRYAISRGITDEQILRWRIMYGIDGDMVGRIVFPLRTLGGEWSSFHARTYAGHEKRYKNASEADGFDPGAIFGEELWPFDAGIKKASTVVLTEGAINALACERAGATFVAAIGGSEAHARQLLKLSMWGRLVAVTDPDDAGDRLAASLQAQLARTTVVERAPIPKGTDAAAMKLAQLREVLNVIGVH